MARVKSKAHLKSILVFVRCRAYGHPWNDFGWLPKIRTGLRLWEQQFECTRCGGTRTDQRTHGTFELVWRWYDLPDGYPGGMKQREAIAILTADSPDRALDEYFVAHAA